jgi:uncharacterized protein (DUF305 family)
MTNSVAIAVVTAISTLTLSACASDTAQDTGTAEMATTETATTETATAEMATGAPFTDSDLMFAEMMIPHHEQAIEMSLLAVKVSQDAEVVALAQEILAAQAPEIEQMKTWGNLNLEAHAGHTMMGMLTPDQMSALSAATGSAFDRLFLEGMIAHHEGAIQMAQMVIQSPNAEARKLGEEIIASQTAEIELMQKMLAAREK